MSGEFLIWPQRSGRTFLFNWLKHLEEEKEMKVKEWAREIVLRKDGHKIHLKNKGNTYQMVESITENSCVIKFVREAHSHGSLDLSNTCFDTIAAVCKAFGIEATRTLSLADIPTKDLVEELKEREGVSARWLENPDSICLLKEGPGMTLVAAEGPGAQILIITD